MAIPKKITQQTAPTAKTVVNEPVQPQETTPLAEVTGATALFNRSHCKERFLHYSKEYHNGKFERVGGDMWPWLNREIDLLIARTVKQHVLKGKTLRPIDRI